jgi:hypothetical protein
MEKWREYIHRVKDNMVIFFVEPDGETTPVPVIKGGGGGGSAPPPPEPTEEEREIQSIILGQLRGGSEMQELLMPYMMEEMGFRVGERAADPKYTELTSQLDALKTEMEDVRDVPGFGALAEANRRRIGEQIETLEREREGLDAGGRTIDRVPFEERLAGMEPQERKAYELHDAYLDQQLKAVRGELPISPALERDISEQRGLVQEDLSRRLGPQYRRSTAGIQTEARFQEGANIAREQARRGVIGQGAGLISGSQAGLVGGQQARQAGLYGAPQSYYGGIGAGGQALQPYQFQRGLIHQSNLQTAANRAQSRAGLYGLAGAGLGAYGTYAGLAA